MNIMNIKYLFLPNPKYQVQVYKNNSAFERTTLFYEYEILPDHQLIHKLNKNTYPYRQAIPFAEKPILQGVIPRLKEPVADVSVAANSFGNNSSSTIATTAQAVRKTNTQTALSKGSSRIITSPSPDKLEIESDAVRPGILLFSENYHPYWKAKVNGKEVMVLKAFTTLIAVEVPQGKSTVELHYQSDAVETSKTLVYIGFSLVLLLIGLQFVIHPRKSNNTVLRSQP